MSRIAFDYEGIHTLAAEQAKRGVDVSWDGWTLVFWKPNTNGFNDRNGAFKNGKWGVQARVSVDSDGNWRVPIKYASTRRKGT